jgi:hypothetical protein
LQEAILTKLNPINLPLQVDGIDGLSVMFDRSYSRVCRGGFMLGILNCTD